MQDGTYLSRNSATLGPLTSQPPCVGRLTGRCRIQLDRLESSVGGTQCKRSVGGSVAEKSLSGNLRTRSFHIPSAISFSIFGLSPTQSAPSLQPSADVPFRFTVCRLLTLVPEGSVGRTFTPHHPPNKSSRE
jgi:hypothetical protein